MNICVVGTGYVGLVTGAVFADLGNDIVCVDKDRDKIEALRAGRMPIYEPGLEEMVARNVDDRRLSFTTDMGAGIRHADVIFIAVGTPPKDTGETDLSQVEAVGAEVGRGMDRYKGVGNKSTVPVGTGRLLREGISQHQTRPMGVGGSCFPKDVDSLTHTAGQLGYDFKLLRSVADINRERATHLVESIGKALGPLDDKVVAVLGLAFKPNTDDMREAKSVEVIHLLHQTGARVRAYDPVAMDNARPLLPAGVAFASSPYEAAQGADAAVLITEWNEFKYLNLERLRGLLRRPVIFDGRNLYEPERMRRLGFEYHSVGRKPVLPA